MAFRRAWFGWALLVAGGLLAVPLFLWVLPEPRLRWAPIGTGALWTVGLIYFDVAISRDPGRFGLIGGVARAAGPRSAALVCGLLTLLLLLAMLRGTVGWPEGLLAVLTLILLVRWLVATVLMLRRTARRSEGMRRKPERWKPLR